MPIVIRGEVQHWVLPIMLLMSSALLAGCGASAAPKADSTTVPVISASAAAAAIAPDLVDLRTELAADKGCVASGCDGADVMKIATAEDATVRALISHLPAEPSPDLVATVQATRTAAIAVIGAYPALDACWKKNGTMSLCVDLPFFDARAALAHQVESWRAFGV